MYRINRKDYFTGAVRKKQYSLCVSKSIKNPTQFYHNTIVLTVINQWMCSTDQ